MIAPTHSIFGIFLTLIVLALFGIKLSLHWSILLFAILGSIIPDIDHPRSLIGRLFHPISSRLEKRYGHRTITHSLIGWGFATITFLFAVQFIVWTLGFVLKFDVWILNLVPRWIAAFSLSYLSHLILDMFNKRGSQFFWPFKTRDVIPGDHRKRIHSGSRSEIIVFLIVTILMLLSFPISKHGLSSTLRWLLATSGSAIEEFKASDTVTYLEFKGYLTDTKQPLQSSAEILDVQNKRLLILLKDPLYVSEESGHIYTISDELASDILAEKLRVKRTSRPLKVERKEFKNQTREFLLSQIPEGARISGVIDLPHNMNVIIPYYAGTFKPIEQKANKLYLHYANREMIEELGLTEQYDLQKEKDLAELSMLHVKAKKIKNQIKNIQNENRLTELGQQLLLTPDEIEKQNTQLEDFNSQLREINIMIKEVNLRIQSRKFVFSGSVYIRM